MNRYQLIVFDWDGTLMDSEARIVSCMQAAAADLELSIPSREQARDIIGLGLNEAVARLFPQLLADEVQRLADRYRHHFLGDNPTREQLFPQAAEILTTLDQAGFLLGVATGKSRRGLQRSLDSTGLGPLFCATRCADETFSKPHPQMLNEVMELAGVESHATLVIGDTEYDMQMAANAGADAIAVSYGVHHPERLLEAGALACLDRLEQLIEWLAIEKDALST